MGDTPTAQPKTIEEIIREVGDYTPEAFEFVRDAVTAASERIHGPLNKAQQKLVRWMNTNGVGFEELQKMLEQGEVPPMGQAMLDQAGGLSAMNRHVSGQDLCRVLRAIAIERWGLMARTVFDHWGVHATHDFGRIVFALVDNHVLSKQPNDTIRDFDRVFDFAEAFDRGYTVQVGKPA